MRSTNGGNWKVTSELQDPAPFTSSRLPLTGSSSSSQLFPKESRVQASSKKGFLAPLQDLQPWDLQPHGAWLRFQESGGLGRYCAMSQAALVLSLQGVTKVRESQMSITHQAPHHPLKISQEKVYLSSSGLVQTPLWDNRAMWNYLPGSYCLCWACRMTPSFGPARSAKDVLHAPMASQPPEKKAWFTWLCQR